MWTQTLTQWWKELNTEINEKTSCVLGLEELLLLGYFFFNKDLFIYLFLRGKGKEIEININVWAPLTCPVVQSWPKTQAYPLTRNWTSDPLVWVSAFKLVSHTSQGWLFLINKTTKWFNAISIKIRNIFTRNRKRILKFKQQMISNSQSNFDQEHQW